MYVWQGGQEGGNAVADVLTGRVNPSGRLSDTIADGIGAYPSTENFGDVSRNYYREDVYVGYRYFETFAKELVYIHLDMVCPILPLTYRPRSSAEIKSR